MSNTTKRLLFLKRNVKNCTNFFGKSKSVFILLFLLSMHQQSLHGVRFATKPLLPDGKPKLVSDFVSSMSVDVWSDADVIPAVEDYSNALQQVRNILKGNLQTVPFFCC